jgi:hypothetical protein
MIVINRPRKDRKVYSNFFQTIQRQRIRLCDDNHFLGTGIRRYVAANGEWVLPLCDLNTVFSTIRQAEAYGHA